MAEPITYDVKPTPIGPDAREELDRLLQSLHERGILRFANDIVCAQTQIAKVLVDGIGKEGTMNAIQNLSILGMALSRIPPEEFYKLVFGLKDAIAEVNKHGESGQEGEAPGVIGVYRMLQDDKLWASLHPLIEGMKAFSDRMGEEAEKPVTRFTGKPTDN